MTLEPTARRLSFPWTRIFAPPPPLREPEHHGRSAREMVIHDTFCPYRGLKPFEEDDHPFFVGREDDARIIIANLYASPLTVLYGASGVGKTSVLQAGVLPLLRQVQDERPAVVLFRTWQTEDFAAALRAEVRQAVMDAGGEAGDSGALPLDEYLEQCAGRLKGPVLLVFDQFEEYFMYHPEPGPPGFEAQLARAVNQRLPKVRFLFCMREEGLSSLDRFRRRIPNVMGNLLRVEPLDREGARRAIQEPLDTYNRLRGEQKLLPMSIDPQLVEQLLDQEITFERSRRGTPEHLKAARDRPVQLPFLQLILTRLWTEERNTGSRRLRADTLVRMGGANAVVHSHLKEALRARLTPRQRRVAARTFWYLVTPGQTKIAHTPADLAEMTGYERTEVESVLRPLAHPEVRILRRIDPVPGTQAEERYEITHDALAPAILHWREKHERRQRDLWAGLGAFAVLSLLVILFLGFREWSTRERFKEDRRVQSAELVAISRLLLASNPRASLDSARRALVLHPTPGGHELALRAAFDDRLLHVLAGQHGGRPLWSVAFNRRGTRLVSAGEDHALVIWRMRDRTPERRVAGLHADTIYRAVFSPDGRSIATASDDGTVSLWSMDRPTSRRRFRSRGAAPVLSVEFTRDGRSVLVGSANGRVAVWPLAASWTSRSFRTRWGHAAAVAGDSSGERIAVGSEHSIVSVWSAASLARTWAIENSALYVQDVEFAPGGALLATASRDGTGRVWNVETERIQVRLRGHTDWIYDIAWSPDATVLATASRDGTIRLWDAASGQVFAVLRSGGGAVRSVAFSPEGDQVASAHDDGSVRLWRATRPDSILRTQLATGAAEKVRRDSADEAAGAPVPLSTARLVRVPGRPETDSVHAAMETPDRRWRIATTDDGAWIWRLGGGAATQLPPPAEGIPVPFFTPDARWAVLADPQGGVSVFRCEVCSQFRAAFQHADGVGATAARPPAGPTPD